MKKKYGMRYRKQQKGCPAGNPGTGLSVRKCFPEKNEKKEKQRGKNVGGARTAKPKKGCEKSPGILKSTHREAQEKQFSAGTKDFGKTFFTALFSYRLLIKRKL